MKNLLQSLQEMVEFLNRTEMKSVQTSIHAHTVERFIRTFKDNLYRRLDALNQTKKYLVQTYR